MNYTLVVAVLFVGFALIEAAAGRLLHRDKTTAKDLILELVGGVGLSVLVLPFVLSCSAGLLEALWPGSEAALAHWPAWSMFALLVLADDLAQYGWHRLAHATPWLYRLHRAHHSGEYISVRVTYRNHLLYYLFMPSLWLTGALLHLGFAPVYYGYAIAKMVVVISSHSSVAWDEPLLRRRWGRALMWLVARIIVTPSTHAAHHGKHESDGVTHYRGNYGNFFFLWDVLFGTAKITGRRPSAYGLERVASATWQQEALWPLVPASEASVAPRA